MRSLEKPVDDRELERIREYETEAAVLSANIAREEMQVGIANEKHAIFALGVTLLSIAITLSGMSIIASRQVLWCAGIVLGSAGSALVCWGIFRYL